MYAIMGITGKVAANSHATCSPPASAFVPSCVTQAEAKSGCTWLRGRARQYGGQLSASRRVRRRHGDLHPTAARVRPERGYPEARPVIDGIVEGSTKAWPARVLCLSTTGADAVHGNLLSQRTMMEAALRKLPAAADDPALSLVLSTMRRRTWRLRVRPV
jgi:NAD(P)H dehydrogenase (quinone)